MLVTLGMFALITVHVLYNEVVWAAHKEPAANLIQAIGYSGLSLSSECTSSRNPILEYTCLTDVPGGYCYHESCGMVAPTTLGTTYHLEVTHR
ncbi:MAG: hypothetical protein ACE14S_02170 [Candidatus Bathyarchaeia archaeon]